MRGRTFLVVRAAAAAPHFWLCARGERGNTYLAVRVAAAAL